MSLRAFILTHKHEFGVTSRLFRGPDRSESWFDLDGQPTPQLDEILAQLGLDYCPAQGEELFLDEVDLVNVVELPEA
jgi:hypothetical protein